MSTLVLLLALWTLVRSLVVLLAPQLSPQLLSSNHIGGDNTNPGLRGHSRQPDDFVMEEALKMLGEDTQPIRTTEIDEWASAQTEDLPVFDTTSQAERLLEVLVKIIGNKDVGKATIKPERMCILMDFRQALYTTVERVNGRDRLRNLAKEDVQERADEHFDEEETTEQTSGPSWSPAPESDEEDSTSENLPATKLRSLLEKMRLDNLPSKGTGALRRPPGGHAHMMRADLLPGRGCDVEK